MMLAMDSEVRWLEAEKTPWGVPVLDIQPITLGMLSMSSDPLADVHVGELSLSDGRTFIGQRPAVERTHRLDTPLAYPVDGLLADGVLFAPQRMEHRWALFFHGGHILCVQSWRFEVMAVADVVVASNEAQITALHGAFTSADEEPEFSCRVLDYLLRSHALDTTYPVPLPAHLGQNPEMAALWCMSHFGNQALVATPHRLSQVPVEEVLRTDSLLHLAVAFSDSQGVIAELERGVPIDLRARDGLTPLGWAMVREDTEMIALLGERGATLTDDERALIGA